MSIVNIRESGQAKGTGKRWEAKLISADVWGTTAFYPAEVLARDASTAFPVGTKMYENHMTESEQWERPVGDVSKLIGKLSTAGEYIPDHPEGPGVYAEVEFYDSYVPRIAEIGEDVGLSVDGGADYVEGERDQRYGKIVTGIPFIRSVDVVVAGGAGGKIISINESDGPMDGVPVNQEGDQSVTAITKDEFVASLAEFGKTLTTQIKEALAPQVVTPEPVIQNAEDAIAAVQKAQVEEPAAQAVETPAEEKPVEVDYAGLVTAVVAAALPAEVVPNVVAAVQGGATVEDAIKGQTQIREAFLRSSAPGTVRIVEAGDDPTNRSVKDEVLAIFKN